VNGDAIRILHVSDLHCVSDPRCRVYGELSDENLDAVLSRSLRDDRRPDAVICTGDVADDSSSEVYERVAERLRLFAQNAFWVPGNHDTPGQMTALAPQGFPNRASIGGWQLLFLDSAWADHNEGRIGPAQLAWLDTQLLQATGHVAVILHHPPVPACDDAECQLSDAGDLLELIHRHPRVRTVITGHNHRPFERRRGSIDFLGAPSTCRQAHHEAPRHAWTNEGPAARSITLFSDGSIDNAVTWLRTPPADLQLTWWT
jgi:Icc protein